MYKSLWPQEAYRSVSSRSLVATAPNMITETRYRTVVHAMAARVPTGIERWVSFKDAERFDPAIIPVTAGKKRPSNPLQVVHMHNTSAKLMTSCSPHD
jgi:hypothetical protein